MATPPSRGVGTVWTSLARGALIDPNRTMSIRAIPVVR